MVKYVDECKNWISSIQTLKLEDIDATKIKNIESNDESNKYLFKVLLHLSHCADKCCRESLNKESSVYKIAIAICNNLTIIPDKDKLFKALYYIIFYMLQRQCITEAQILSKFLLSDKVLEPDNGQNYPKYFHLAGLWQKELFRKLDTWSSKSSIQTKAEINEEFINNVIFHLKILKHSEQKYRYIFFSADTYIKKLAKVPLDIAFPCLDKIFSYLSNHMSELKQNLVIDAYSILIISIGAAFTLRSDAKDNPKISNYWLHCDSYFTKLFAKIPQCSDCYKLFRLYTEQILKTNFMQKEIEEMHLDKFIEVLQILLHKYGADNNILVSTVTAIAWTFETIFSNWELLVSSKSATVTQSKIVKMGNFVKNVHNIFVSHENKSYVCKQCLIPDACIVKKDLYQASIFTAAYIKVLAKVNQETLDQEIFTVAKDLLKKILSALRELENSNCKYSNVLWETCGRLIFNFGLISENKYPAQLGGLYEVLCKKIIHYDGISAKLSCFGLENPVGTSLHRLCNIYFNQEKYREAMSFAAYNALLSNLNTRKKKACDMWANIKLKTKDIKEYQNLTMSECLKNDVNVVKKLGIDINLDNYNLNEICVRELSSLFLIKGDIISIMKKTLNELESRQCITEFAQGTLLLCCHALQLKEREYISNYISKAIEKLKNSKQNTVNDQCLLTNLNFFNIVEKLYMRSKIIEKEMEVANFTIKDFKVLHRDEVNGVVDNDNEIIVPTFGGINITEDNKLANELRDILNTWEACIQKNMSGIISGWEPKFTLETILLCGEYCRLYKLGVIEEKVWKIAYKLATAMKDFSTCIYVTSRSLSLKFLNNEWLNNAKIYVEKANLNNPTECDTVALFWLSLAEFYLDCKKVEEAKVLLNKVKSMSSFKSFGGTKLYIYLVDIQFRNYFSINSKTSQEDYSQLMVEIHYLLINAYDNITPENAIRFWSFKYHLIAYDMMFEAVSTITIPMSSLLSYRDVVLHLSMTLKCAQKLGISVRIAELLKYLCYIDILCSHVDKCETHLQDFEHVLCLNVYQASEKNKLQKKPIKSSDQPAVRDATEVVPISLPKNIASPELKKKLFIQPSFFKHTRLCQCFYCMNLHYQQLIFSCNHIQAQLYSLLKYAKESECYFDSAYKVKLKIDERDLNELRKSQENYHWKRPQKYVIDYMMYLLDLSMFIIDFLPEQKDDALEVIKQVQNMASDNDLGQHCITYYATELYAQHYIYDALQNKLNISVPLNIPIEITNSQLENCITPKIQIDKSAVSLRRRKSPPVISLPAITIFNQSEVENNTGNSSGKTKPCDEKVIIKNPKKTGIRNVRRKLLSDELGDVQEEPKKEVKRSARLMKKSTG